MNDLRKQSIGILGAGQLGRMLGQAAIPLNLKLHSLDPTPNPPALGSVSSVSLGSFKDFDDVIAFGSKHDIITVEIEEVNVEALEALQESGKKVYPYPSTLRTIRDKGTQKEFYRRHNIPTMPFQIFANAQEVRNAFVAGSFPLPFVQKSRRDGYDGQGVRVIRTDNDLDNLLDVPCIVEVLCNVHTEISVIVSRNPQGQIETWAPVEMVFEPKANLIDFLASPARIEDKHSISAKEIAIDIAQKLDLVGILAVELFIDQDGQIIVNEVAPRPHNSGHQTIENSVTSQYSQHLRAITGLPLGSTELTIPSVMLNLTGCEGHSGTAIFSGVEDVLAISGVSIHDYGKEQTRPFRKMGHVTVIDRSLESALKKATKIKSILKVISL